VEFLSSDEHARGGVVVRLITGELFDCIL
jgi:hypothetical protein